MRSWTGELLLRTIEKLDPALCRTAPGFGEPTVKDLPSSIGQPESEPTPQVTVQLLLEPVGARLRMELEFDLATLIQFAGLLADNAPRAGGEQRRTPVAIQLVTLDRSETSLQNQGGPAHGTDCEAALPGG